MIYNDISIEKSIFFQCSIVYTIRKFNNKILLQTKSSEITLFPFDVITHL